MNAQIETNWQGEAKTNWVGTNLGKRVDLSFPQASEIVIEDIAQGLGNLCRFTGQISKFYSVAEHCMHVADLVPPPFKRIALLHDASEAYIADISTPLKNELGAAYRQIENRITEAIDQAFGCDGQLVLLPACVRAADRMMLMTERDALVAVRKDWGEEFEQTIRHPGFVHRYTDPAEAVQAYLDYYVNLTEM